MKFLAIALDYDGTIAKDNVLDPKVRAAIARLRSHNVVVMIVTGRILADLRQVAGDLHFVDAVVAENGAAIEFTDSGYSRLLGDPPPAAFLDALRNEGIPFTVGQSVVEAEAREGARLLAVIQRLELPLVLIFNHGRVMVLPQAITKATGLREALKILRLSPHNTVAIGDAENDHELLRSCELGVAVEWGSEALKASADYILPGAGPAAVADYIEGLGKTSRIPTPLTTRRQLQLGYMDSGIPMNLAIRGRTILVSGDTKSGKSWVTGLMCEQMILYGYSLFIIDPEGDYTSLEALPGVVVYGGAEPLPHPRELVRSLRHADVSIVMDLSHVSHEEKVSYVSNLLPAMATLRRCTGLPHRIVIDEAHYFMHHQNSKALLDLDEGAYTLATYKSAQLQKEILALAEAAIVTRESDPLEVSKLRSICGYCAGQLSEEGWAQMLGSLVVGEAAVLPLTNEACGGLRRIHLAPRLTPHARHVSKYIDIPIPVQDQFVFWRDGALSGERAGTLREFVSVLEHVSTTSLNGHLHRNDFSKWLSTVFGDYPLADSVHQMEETYRSGQLPNALSSIVEAIRSRYDFVSRLRNYTIRLAPSH